MSDGVHTEEENTLNRCISRIDEIIDEDKHWLSTPKEEAILSGEAARVMRKKKEQNIKNLQEARPNPYFGRVDFVCDETPDKIETYYFGKYHVPLEYVYNWQAPIGRLFYQPLGNKYQALSGDVTGTVKLKRELLIQNARLLQITEYPLLPPGAEIASTESTPLTRELSKPKAAGLGDIVATIQPEQYEKIAASPQRVMIIQGVAGSGKSDVGLHRIAYLLSPYNELGLTITPSHVVFFGPSKVFLKYIANLLPGLGVNRVKQTTVSEWLRSILSARIKLQQKDGLLERILNTKKNLDVEVQLAKLKVSLEMARILDKYVQSMRTRFINGAIDIVNGQDVIIKRIKVKSLISRFKNQPLNEQRNQALAQIENEFQKGVLTKLNDQVKRNIKAQFDGFWPEIDFREVYSRLLSNADELLVASNGTITRETAERFVGLPSTKREVFAQEDLPALCYLDGLLNNQRNIRKKQQASFPFDHIVIDEAQDVSPLEFLLLYLQSSNKSFTILGDIEQRLLPHRGINNWREMKPVFSGENPQRWNARISYRATFELTRYANRILRKIAPKTTGAVPYARHGEKPSFIRSKSYADMVTAIADDVKLLRTNGVQSIAILCKTSNEASRLLKELRGVGIEDAVLPYQKTYDRSKTTVSPILEIKGLEFDAVILANARRNNYISSDLHNRLLYIAVTRAAHVLHIHWFGPLADVLEDPALLPKTTRLKRRNKSGKVKKNNRRAGEA